MGTKNENRWNGLKNAQGKEQIYDIKYNASIIQLINLIYKLQFQNPIFDTEHLPKK